MKHHILSSKMGETTGGSAKKRSKSQNQQGPSSQKKETDREGRKQDQKRKHVAQAVKRKAKEHGDYSPAGEKGSSKKVKLTSAKTESWQTLSETMPNILVVLLSLELFWTIWLGTLKVPPGMLGNLKKVPSLQMAEKQMLEANEESLVQLQEEINEAEQSAEHTEEAILQLEHKIQVLRNQLEEDEKKARKVFQENVRGELHLPELPKHSLQAPTLQEEILKIKNQKGLLKDMNIIQQSADLKNMLTLIEKTYEKVDFL
uniref:Centromere protein Q n=1 Tax=Otus sunia TaxID=257818 RepID=A0A8C8AW01_9STRI